MTLFYYMSELDPAAMILASEPDHAYAETKFRYWEETISVSMRKEYGGDISKTTQSNSRNTNIKKKIPIPTPS